MSLESVGRNLPAPRRGPRRSPGLSWQRRCGQLRRRTVSLRLSATAPMSSTDARSFGRGMAGISLRALTGTSGGRCTRRGCPSSHGCPPTSRQRLRKRVMFHTSTGSATGWRTRRRRAERWPGNPPPRLMRAHRRRLFLLTKCLAVIAKVQEAVVSRDNAPGVYLAEHKKLRTHKVPHGANKRVGRPEVAGRYGRPARRRA